MFETLDKLPGEGDTKTKTEVCIREECDVCGEPAHYKHTFLYDRARSNPASAAYGKDDCSWCEDASRFVCREHENDREPPQQGMGWCSTFPACERFKHMFLRWVEVKGKAQ